MSYDFSRFNTPIFQPPSTEKTFYNPSLPSLQDPFVPVGPLSKQEKVVRVQTYELTFDFKSHLPSYQTQQHLLPSSASYNTRLTFLDSSLNSMSLDQRFDDLIPKQQSQTYRSLVGPTLSQELARSPAGLAIQLPPSSPLFFDVERKLMHLRDTLLFAERNFLSTSSANQPYQPQTGQLTPFRPNTLPNITPADRSTFLHFQLNTDRKNPSLIVTKVEVPSDQQHIFDRFRNALGLDPFSENQPHSDLRIEAFTTGKQRAYSKADLCIKDFIREPKVSPEKPLTQLFFDLIPNRGGQGLKVFLEGNSPYEKVSWIYGAAKMNSPEPLVLGGSPGFPADPNKSPVYYVNGINNSKRDCDEGAKKLLETFDGEANVVPFYSQTLGKISDLKSVWKVREDPNYTSLTTERLSNRLKWDILCLEAMNDPRKIFIVGFSRGTGEISRAVEKLTPEQRERLIITACGPIMTLPRNLGFKVDNLISEGDWCSLFFHPELKACLKDYNGLVDEGPVRAYLKHKIDRTPYRDFANVALVPQEKNDSKAFIKGHFFVSKTYQKAIKEMIREFYEDYGVKK